MPRGLLAIIDALLVVHYSTHAVLIVGGLAWLATALGFEPDQGGRVPAALIAILSLSIAWQSVRLFAIALRSGWAPRRLTRPGP